MSVLDVGIISNARMVEQDRRIWLLVHFAVFFCGHSLRQRSPDV